MRRVSRRSASPDRIAAVSSAWSRSRRDTGDGTSGGDAEAVDGERRGRQIVGRSRPSGRSALRRSGVLLTLRFLALALHAGLLVVLAATRFREDARLLNLLVEAAQGALERLVFAYSDFCQ